MQTESSVPDITTVLAEMVSAVVGQLDMDSLLPKILDTTMNTLHADVCSIYLKDKESGKLKCLAGTGFAQDIIGVEYDIGEGLTGKVFQEGIPRNIKDKTERDKLVKDGILKGKHDDKQWAPDSGRVFRNLLALPLKIKEESLGVIKVENKKIEYGEQFTEDDLKIFTTIANVIALAIENARSHQRAEEQSRKITTILASVAGEVVGAFDMQKLLDKVIKTTMDTLNAEVCSIFLRKDDDPEKIICVAGSGFAKEIEKIAEYNKGEGFTGTVFSSGKEFNVKSKAERDNYVLEGTWKKKHDAQQWGESGVDKFRNLLALPLKIKDQIFGVIKVENKIGQEPFTDEDMTLFRTIANVIALTIENARLHQQIETNLKGISGKAAHRIGNLVLNYDYLEIDFEVELDKPTLDKGELKKLVERMVNATQNLKRMLKEFRSYGRPLELKKDLVNINEIIQYETNSVQTADIIVHTNLDSNLPLYELDRAKFEESIRELLNNSKRAIDKSETKSGNISVKTSFNAEYIEILIEDDGPGISSDFPLFVPFRSTNPDSTGLGLVTVREQMKAYGGDIEYVKKEAKGACFKITLPLKK
jgi:signal transduction protein with GAF and PtsI domain/anti-sigma regulatory factor (Ser/Thr protein kinase)